MKTTSSPILSSRRATTDQRVRSDLTVSRVVEGCESLITMTTCNISRLPVPMAESTRSDEGFKPMMSSTFITDDFNESQPSGHSIYSSGHSSGPSGYSSRASGHCCRSSGHSSQTSGYSSRSSGHSSRSSGHSTQASGQSSICTWTIYDDTDLCLEDSYMRDVVPTTRVCPDRNSRETFTVTPRTSTMIRTRNRDHVVPDSDPEEFYSTPRDQRVPCSDDDSDEYFFSMNMERPKVPGKEDSPTCLHKTNTRLQRHRGTTKLLDFSGYSRCRRVILRRMKAFNRDCMDHVKRSSVETLAILWMMDKRWHILVLFTGLVQWYLIMHLEVIVLNKIMLIIRYLFSYYVHGI